MNEKQLNSVLLNSFNEFMITHKCTRCELGLQKNIQGCCVSRGSISSNKMIVGEGPGLIEDQRRTPLVGPAGQLLDKIFQSVELNTNDFYITNILLCRPVAPEGSGKQNLSPKDEWKDKCSLFLHKQINILNPKLIVTLGKHATLSLLGQNVKLNEVKGKEYFHNNYFIFPMYHPAYILHSKKDPEHYKRARKEMWEDIQKLKELIKKKSL